MTTNDGVLIELDARHRASLGKLARHRRYLASLEPNGTIVLTPARIVPADEIAHFEATGGNQRLADELLAMPDSVQVAFCNWCPEPEKPSPEFHPDGQSEHVEEVPIRREHPTHALDSDLRRLGVSDVGRYFVTGPLGAPPGAAERLPTVGHWSNDLTRLEMPAPFACDKCGRKSVHSGRCGMTQPDNTICEGVIS